MWINENLAAAFGYRAEDVEPTGAWWEEHLHPEDRGRIAEGIQGLIQSGGSAWTAEYRFRRKDRTYATVVDRGYVLHHRPAHPVRRFGSTIDVTTERKARAIQSSAAKSSRAAN